MLEEQQCQKAKKHNSVLVRSILNYSGGGRCHLSRSSYQTWCVLLATARFTLIPCAKKMQLHATGSGSFPPSTAKLFRPNLETRASKRRI